ncbi:MAG: endonuclease I family protein, partial [Marinicellaceae bacterium]
FPDACDILEDADEDPSNPNNVWMVYSNESYVDGNACSGSYNREHTWPRSRFTGENESTPGRDTHQLMATTVSYNTARGNRYFDNCLTGCSNVGLTTTSYNGVGGSSDRGDSNWRDNSVFEVWDYRKGDIARAMFYMDVRYEGDDGEPDLQLTDNLAQLVNITENFMGSLSTLCEWHYADPVDSNDTSRNEVVFSFQENKNPFIDHPEWVAKVFEDTPACLGDVDNDIIFSNGFEQNSK